MQKSARHFFSRLRLAPFRIAATYAVVSLLWIYFSDTILGMLVHDPQTVTAISVVKGSLFVVVTSGLIYILIRRDILRTFQREESLQESERRFRALFEQAAVGVAQVRSDTGRFERINRKYCDIVGYSREEMAESDFLQITHPDDLAGDLVNMELLKSGQIREFAMEKRYWHKDGSLVWVNLTVSPMWAPGEAPDFHIAVVEDITKRKQAEEALRESEALRKRIFDTSVVPIVVMDAETLQYVDCNPAAAQIYRVHSRDEVLGKTPVDFSAPLQYGGAPSAEKARSYIDEALARGMVVFEWRHQRSDGEIWDAEVHLMSFHSGRRQMLQFTLQDITARRQADEELRRQQSRLEELVRTRTTELVGLNERLTGEIEGHKKTEAALENSRNYLDKIINSLPDPVFVKDREHRWVLLNDLFCSFMGKTREELLGKSDRDFFPKTEADVFWAKDEEVFSTGAENLNEEFFTDGKGMVRTIMTKKTLYTDNTGNAVLVGIIRDMTDFKRASEQLAAAQDRMVQSEKMASLGQLIAGIAHEINNPAAYVLCNLEILKKYETRVREYLFALKAVFPEGREDLKKLETDLDMPEILRDLSGLLDESITGAQRIGRIVQDFRVFAHPEGGDWGYGDLHRVLESALNIAGVQFEGRVEVVRDFGVLPPVHMKEQQMTQVFINLLSNAAQAIVRHGTITIRTYARDGKVFIEVADSGAGIARENLSKIFEPFFTTKDVGKGTGLGLSVVHSIIRQHQGSILVRSAPGEGAVFIVQLPVDGVPHNNPS